MFLKNLSIVNFKNYDQADFKFVDGINCFVGKNGTGKSNALDAIHYMSMCKSYINPYDKQNISFHKDFFVVQAVFEKDQEDYEVYCGVKNGSKKIFKKNKVEYEKLADHIGEFPSVVISPYDRNLISEGGETRRKWIDSILSQVDRKYIESVILYNKAIAQRNMLLKQQYENGFFQREEIELWDYQLSLYGNYIYSRRKEFIDEFLPIFRKYYHQLGESTEEVSIQYDSHLSDGMSFENILKESYPKDAKSQYTNKGIHRDDLSFELNNHLIRKIGSQGQQKTFLIALRLAQFEWLNGKMKLKPLFLLDDIFDKLDNSRVEKLIQLIANNFFGQIFISDTDQDRLEKIFSNIVIPIHFIKTS